MDLCHPGNQSLLEFIPFFFFLIANHTAMGFPGGSVLKSVPAMQET